MWQVVPGPARSTSEVWTTWGETPDNPNTVVLNVKSPTKPPTKTIKPHPQRPQARKSYSNHDVFKVRNIEEEQQQQPFKKEALPQHIRSAFVIMGHNFTLAILGVIPILPWAIFQCFLYTSLENKYTYITDWVTFAGTIFIQIFIPLLLLVATFGWQNAKSIAWINIVFGVLAIAVFVANITGAMGDIMFYLAYILFVAALIVTSVVIAVKHKHKLLVVVRPTVLNFVLLFALPFVAIAVFLIVSDLTIIPAFIEAKNDEFKSVVRIVINPVFWTVLSVAMRNCSRCYNSENAIMSSILPMFVKVFFGRMFNSNFSNLGTVALNAFLVFVTGIGVRFAHWYKGYFFHKFFPQFKTHYLLGPALYSPISDDELYAEHLNSEKALELLSIGYTFFVSILYTALSTNSDPVALGNAGKVMVVQLVIEVAGQLIITVFELQNHIPVQNPVRNWRWFLAFFTIECILMSSFCAGRMVRFFSNKW